MALLATACDIVGIDIDVSKPAFIWFEFIDDVCCCLFVNRREQEAEGNVEDDSE
jgi:hypothetical protein